MGHRRGQPADKPADRDNWSQTEQRFRWFEVDPQTPAGTQPPLAAKGDDQGRWTGYVVDRLLDHPDIRCLNSPARLAHDIARPIDELRSPAPGVPRAPFAIGKLLAHYGLPPRTVPAVGEALAEILAGTGNATPDSTGKVVERQALQGLLLDLSLALDGWAMADRHRQNRLRSLADTLFAALPIGVAMVGRGREILSANPAFGVVVPTSGACEGRPLETVLELPAVAEIADPILAGTEKGVAFCLAVPGGEPRKITLREVTDPETPQAHRLVALVEDIGPEARGIDRERRARDRLAEQGTFLEGLLDRMQEGVIACDESGRLTFLNRAAADLLGEDFERERRTGADLAALRLFYPDSGVALARWEHPLSRALADEATDQAELTVVDTSGSTRMVAVTARPLSLDDNRGSIAFGPDEADPAWRATPTKGLGAFLVFQDITDRKAAEERLNHLAYHDPLTGLPNRALLMDRLGQALAYGPRHSRSTAVLFVDLDRFKRINDTLGHVVGDQILKEAAVRLRDAVREGDTISRLGGDEFVMILADLARPGDAASVADKILGALARPFQETDEELYITTSIGISVAPNDGNDADALLANADAAMYRAKEGGGHQYQFYSPEMNQRTRQRLALESLLHRALEREEFYLHYQPQFELATGLLTGFEALLRWDHPDRGPIPSNEFIPILEETGLILPVGEWVIDTACRQHGEWNRNRKACLRMAVNLSARQFQAPGLGGFVEKALRDAELGPDQLELEITESILMANTTNNAKTMSGLRETGVCLSLDDFGTGYSSLAYLKQFPIDKLKIDRSFVRDAPHDDNDAAIARTVIAMAHSLGMTALAEGVETPDQLDLLKGEGCDEGQGHLFATPLSRAEVEDRILGA